MCSDGASNSRPDVGQPGWQAIHLARLAYEIKFDGYRCLARAGGAEPVELRTAARPPCSPSAEHPVAKIAREPLRPAAQVIPGSHLAAAYDYPHSEKTKLE